EFGRSQEAGIRLPHIAPISALADELRGRTWMGEPNVAPLYGGVSVQVGVPFWTDAALIAAAGIPTLLYGPAGEGAHAVVEWVDLACSSRCATSFCGRPASGVADRPGGGRRPANCDLKTIPASSSL